MEDGHIGTSWGKAIIDNTTLIHLDLSFNKIIEKDTETISMALN